MNVAPIIFHLRSTALLRTNAETFAGVQVRSDRKAVHWPGIGGDISAATLARLPGPDMTATEFRQLSDELRLNVNAVSATLGISTRSVADYRSGYSPIPRTVAYAMRHLRDMMAKTA